MKVTKYNNLSQSYVRKTTPDGRKYLHRLVWEEYNKACLLHWITVHHINHIKTDNRIENLEAMMHSDHVILHKTKDMNDRVCINCKTKQTAKDKKGFLVWRKHPKTKEKWYCHKCYCAIQNKRRWTELLIDKERHIQYNIKRNERLKKVTN